MLLCHRRSAVTSLEYSAVSSEFEPLYVCMHAWVYACMYGCMYTKSLQYILFPDFFWVTAHVVTVAVTVRWFADTLMRQGRLTFPAGWEPFLKHTHFTILTYTWQYRPNSTRTSFSNFLVTSSTSSRTCWRRRQVARNKLRRSWRLVLSF